MKTKQYVIGGIVAFVLIIALSVMGSYNSLVSSQTEVEQAQAKIEATLQRRYDLIPNVVNSVKGYMTHEEEVFKTTLHCALMNRFNL